MRSFAQVPSLHFNEKWATISKLLSKEKEMGESDYRLSLFKLMTLKGDNFSPTLFT